MPEDFGSTKSLENAGILDVFQVFQTALLGRKIGHPGEKEFLEVPCSLAFSWMIAERKNTVSLRGGPYRADVAIPRNNEKICCAGMSKV